ncbi:MAG: phosphohistidine phosphatase SixA [Spirochaetes bacterium RBG_16_49_21]|nr:MAG: phosphohistidine phosphatase SixA [Spirochaetes bacterium RBG_16_49_21]
MALYLVQHGKSHPGEIDPERGLTDQGREEVAHIARAAKESGIKINAIIHSGKKRARETAEILAAELGPQMRLDESSGMDPNDDVVAFSARLDAGKNSLYVGHLPFMERLASYLITGSSVRPVFKFQNGGILCLDLHPQSGTWVITGALVPHIT